MRDDNKIDENKIFHRVTEKDRTADYVPIQIWDSIVIDPGKILPGAHFTCNFAGHPGTSDAYLFQMVEAEIIDRALCFDNIFNFIAMQLGFDAPSSWCLIGEKRHRILPPALSGKPGDFDIIMGRFRNGQIMFNEIGEAEIKIRKVDVDKKPKRFASGVGTRQATGAAELGFNRVLLMHVLVNEGREVPQGCSESWRPMENTDFFDSMRASAGLIRRIETNVTAPYGYALLGWGQIPGTSLEISGGFSPVPVRAAPYRALWQRKEVLKNRNLFLQGLVARIGSRRPAARFFRSCEKCGCIFTPKNIIQRICC